MEERDAGDTVELIDYLRVLWRQKWIIALTVLTAVVTVWFLSDIPEPKYRISASLLLLPPLASELNVDTSSAVWAPEAYKQLALSTKVLQSVIDQLSLSPDESVPTVTGLRGIMSVDVSAVGSLYDSRARQIFLSLTMTCSNAAQTCHVIEVWIQTFSETFESLFQDRTARSYEYVSQNASDTQAELQAMLEQQELLLLETPIDSLRSYHALLQSRLDSIRTGLANARRAFSKTKSLVAALENELALQPVVYVLAQSISPDSLVGVASELSAREIETLASIQVRSEELNSTYISLDSRIASNRAEVQALEDEIRYLEQSEQETVLLLGETNHQLVEAEAQLHELEREIALLESAYGTLMGQLQNARIALAETPNPIQIIDEPFIPEQAIASRKTANVGIAGFLGLMLGTLLAFFLDYLQRVREREKALQLEAEQDLEILSREEPAKVTQDDRSGNRN
ncbi:GumC family protein [Candidatus Bipolaricaulota bacterium]